MRCSYCGHENPEGELYCSECGMKLDIPSESGHELQIRCENCGVINPEGASVCRNCNQPLVQQFVSEPFRACPRCGFDRNPVTAKFCMNCGAEIAPCTCKTPPTVQPVARLVLPTKREIVISELERTIGRADFLQDVPPEDVRFISREHLKITFENGKYYILDEKSTNGTRLNGAEIKGQGKKEVNDNDEIMLANTIQLKFKIG